MCSIHATGEFSCANSESFEEEELFAAPPLYGHMDKKSPGTFHVGGWDRRFFVLADLKLLWWVSKESMLRALRTDDTESVLRRLSTMKTSDEIEAKTGRKGMIDLALTHAIVEADPASSTIFMVRPIGFWADGATTDIHGD